MQAVAAPIGTSSINPSGAADSTPSLAALVSLATPNTVLTNSTSNHQPSPTTTSVAHAAAASTAPPAQDIDVEGNTQAPPSLLGADPDPTHDAPPEGSPITEPIIAPPKPNVDSYKAPTLATTLSTTISGTSSTAAALLSVNNANTVRRPPPPLPLPSSKKPKKATARNGKNAKSLCKREWIVAHPEGTEEDFATHWTSLTASGENKSFILRAKVLLKEAVTYHGPPDLTLSQYHPSKPYIVNLVIPEQYEHPHALIQDNIYTLYKSEPGPFPAIPVDAFPRNPESKVLKYIPLPDFRMMWIPNEAPFMALVPCFRVFHGPLFSHLAINERRVPLDHQVDGTYILAKDIKDDWISLESNMKAMAIALFELTSIYTPRVFAFWPTPMRYGYAKSYTSPRIAKLKILQSRDAFVPLMATLSLFLLIIDDLQGPNWRKEVISTTGIEQQWLADLELSVVGDLTEPRIGGVVDLMTCAYNNIIPLLRRARLNLVLAWGNDPAALKPPHCLIIERLVPSWQLISKLRERTSTQNFSIPVQSSITSEPTYSSSNSEDPAALVTRGATTPPPSTFPPVEPNCGQRHGEHWSTFFARRQLSNEKSEATETPSDTVARKQREDNASHGRAPGRKGGTVFYWEEIQGFRVRKPAGRKNYERYWRAYGPKQCRYDSFHNQWDVCTNFGEDDVQDSDDDDDDDEHHLPVGDDDILNDLLPETVDPANYHLEGTNSSFADLERQQLGEVFDTTPLVQYRGADELVSHRFGMNFLVDFSELYTGKEEGWQRSLG
ncbi:hypothetical protein DXG01_006487 [Tephrocybe rancida]|nr:hypothetical protein DXG01_006487 [Tephrocybe rancida]